MTDEYRVYGPPGTGKTTWMVSRAWRSVERYGSDMVSLCSLTNAAIREAAGRDLPIDPDNVTTLHARCKRSLGAPPPAELFVYEFAKAYPNYATERDLPRALFQAAQREREDLEEEDVDGLMVENPVGQGDGATHYEQANLLRQMLIPQAQWPASTRAWYAHWSDWCKQNRRPDFTGWLEEAMRFKTLPAQQVVYVDEAQDHTPLQLAVIRQWQSRNHVLIGDDDQNLYQWSGAVPQEFFLPELPEGQEIVLSQSYRVPRAVHALANSWIQRLSSRKHKEYQPRDEDGEVHAGDLYLADMVDTLPDGLLDDPDATYMVLASCGYMLKDLTNLLRRDGIPFHNPYKPNAKAWNPLTTAQEKLRLYQKVGLWTGKEAREWAGLLSAEAYIQHGSRAAFLALCESDPERDITLTELRNALRPEVYSRVMARDISVLKEFKRKGLLGSWDYAFKVAKLPAQQQIPRLIVGTIHSVKGGEADHVTLYPDLSPAGMRDYRSSVDGRDRALRLFYVGMTRARQTLTLGRASSWSAVSW